MNRIKYGILLLAVPALCLSGCKKSAVEIKVDTMDAAAGSGKEHMPAETEQRGKSGDTELAPETGFSKDAAPEEETRRAVPGKKTLLNFLLTAKQPLGNTMYVWGGGWNEEDTAAGEEARSIGVSTRWGQFTAMQDASYNYETTRYQIHDGLDCSGYVGWAVYNVFVTEDGKEGYVGKATKMAEDFAARGWGSYTPAAKVDDWKAGDIMSMKGHVWISLGMCEDGSVVLLHASPPGVILCGTYLSDGSESLAVALARQYMSAEYPSWYEKYPDCARSNSYLTDSAQMRWNNETLEDPEGIREMKAEEVLQKLFE